MKMLRTIGALGATSVLTLGLISCASSEGSGNEPLRLALPFAPVASLSPYTDDGMITTRVGIAETLVTLDKEGRAAPGLAESWETPAPDTLELKLKSDVKFHDGEPLTADAVVTALQSAYDAPTRPRSLGTANLTFEAKDERTVSIRSETADPILPLRFTDPRTAIYSPAGYKASGEAPAIIGTGPFELQDFNESELNATGFDGYWGGEVAEEKLTVSFIKDAGARVNALRAGDIDIVASVPTAQMPLLDSDALSSFAVPRGTYLHFNTSNGVFSDPAQRAAAAKAIDIDVFADVIYEGQADNAHYNPFAPAPEWSTKADYKPTTDGAATPSTQTINIATYVERGELPEALSVVAQQLRDAGFNVEAHTGESTAMEEDLLSGVYDIVIYSRNNALGAPDPVSFLDSDYSCDGEQNISQYCNPEIDAEIEEALTIADLQKRNLRAAEIGAKIVGDNVVLPLVYEHARIGFVDVENIYQDPYERRFITADTTRLR